MFHALMPTATATDPLPPNSHTMHIGLVCKEQNTKNNVKLLFFKPLKKKKKHLYRQYYL